MKADIVIIGVGVVGSAIAREFSISRPDKKIAVLERLAGAGLETSRFNSGVLHSGFHQAPGSLKAELARRGSRMAFEYVKTKGLPALETGMIIAIPAGPMIGGLYREWRSFWRLLKRGRSHDIRFRFLTPRGVRKLEPRVRALGGIFIPEVWVIDPSQFVKALKEDAEKAGVEFFFNSAVEEIRTEKGGYFIKAGGLEIRAEAVINAAGLYADEVAALAGFDQYKIYPWRGEYYEVVGGKNQWIKRLVYPAVPAGYPGKGIHFSPRIDGRLFVGPNSRLVPSKDYYEEDKTPPETFLAAAQRFLPQLEIGDLRWAYSGIRPRLSDKEGEEPDFVIRLDSRAPAFVNLIGIESPGLAAAMAIAEHVAGLIKR